MNRFAYFLTRLGLYTMAEMLFMLGNGLPRAVALRCWRLTRGLNRQHVMAALKVAAATKQWGDFERAAAAVRNPWCMAGSDLYLSWLPGRMVRYLIARLMGGQAAGLHEIHDRVRQTQLAALAAWHVEHAPTVEQAWWAWEVWRGVEGETPRVIWAAVKIELNSTPTNHINTDSAVETLLESGHFLSPLDTVIWAERFLQAGKIDWVEKCLRWGERWIPEMADLWRVKGLLAQQQRDRLGAIKWFTRALALDPAQVAVYMARHELRIGQQFSLNSTVEWGIVAPKTLTVGAKAAVQFSLSDEWDIHVLPPLGWGVIGERDAAGSIWLRGCRPHPSWAVTFVAIRGTEYAVKGIDIAVSYSDQQKQILLVLTEDHEIHEERAVFTADMLEKLLVEKSTFAADNAGGAWTHMIEAGSVFSLGPTDPILAHLQAEVARGNDVQCHFHAFNDPQHEKFPFRLTERGWEPSLKFLLTDPTRRGDFASGLTPQTRVTAVAHVVAQLERLLRPMNPSWSPLLWRSGLLDFGESAADRAWSTVALRRAGLLAGSDVPKPRSPFTTNVRSAHMVDWTHAPSVAGVLLQLPIAANTEGDYLMGKWLLKRRARKAAARARGGIHLFTLLTHDKFINARARGEEFRLEPDYGEWPLIRAHIEAWQAAGAEIVTAREGVSRVLDELTWHVQAVLFAPLVVTTGVIRFEVRLLGKGIPISPATPQAVIVTIPPYLRPYVTDVSLGQGEQVLESEWHRAGGYVWVWIQDRDSLWAEFATQPE